ncbi:MAG: hypothetical protein WCG27_08520 [Pseudomonadota bacterium]
MAQIKFCLIALMMVACTNIHRLHQDHVDVNEHKAVQYLEDNPCWGFENLEKIYLKWNWLYSGHLGAHTSNSYYVQFQIVRDAMKEAGAFESTVAVTQLGRMDEPHKKYQLDNRFQETIYMSYFKKMLIRDQSFFDWLIGYHWRDRDRITKRQGHALDMASVNCRYIFWEQSPHRLRITLRLLDLPKSIDLEIARVEVPFSQIRKLETFEIESKISSQEINIKNADETVRAGVSVALEKLPKK